MNIWEIIQNLEIMLYCIQIIQNFISEIRLHKDWDEEYQSPITKTNISDRLDTIIDKAKQLKEIL